MATSAPAPSGTVDFGRCFTFVTEDPEWITKILLGGLFMNASFLFGAAHAGLLYDLDEQALGTNPEFGNMDLDAFPDGYEVRHGLNPFVYEPLSASPDAQAPRLARPVRLVYATTNTLKFEVETDDAADRAESGGQQ